MLVVGREVCPPDLVEVWSASWLNNQMAQWFVAGLSAELGPHGLFGNPMVAGLTARLDMIDLGGEFGVMFPLKIQDHRPVSVERMAAERP